VWTSVDTLPELSVLYVYVLVVFLALTLVVASDAAADRDAASATARDDMASTLLRVRSYESSGGEK
jgi:hypothetical protein